MIEAAQTVLKDPSVLNAVVFACAAVVGQVLHAVKKLLEGEVWVLGNVKRTIAAVIGNFMAIAAFLAAPNALSGMQVGTILAFGLFMGFSADSVINKGVRKPWTEEERAKKG